MPIKMISKSSHTYGTRRLKAGDEFEVSGQSDARLLHALGRADMVAAKMNAKPVPPAPAPAPAPVAAKTTGRGRWLRKNLENPAEPDSPTVPRDHGLVGSVDLTGLASDNDPVA